MFVPMMHASTSRVVGVTATKVPGRRSARVAAPSRLVAAQAAVPYVNNDFPTPDFSESETYQEAKALSAVFPAAKGKVEGKVRGVGGGLFAFLVYRGRDWYISDFLIHDRGLFM